MLCFRKRTYLKGLFGLTAPRKKCTKKSENYSEEVLRNTNTSIAYAQDLEPPVF